jgi:hypothetical protein
MWVIMIVIMNGLGLCIPVLLSPRRHVFVRISSRDHNVVSAVFESSSVRSAFR